MILLSFIDHQHTNFQLMLNCLMKLIGELMVPLLMSRTKVNVDPAGHFQQLEH